jgi:hypothetical protein
MDYKSARRSKKESSTNRRLALFSLRTDHSCSLASAFGFCSLFYSTYALEFNPDKQRAFSSSSSQSPRRKKEKVVTVRSWNLHDFFLFLFLRLCRFCFQLNGVFGASFRPNAFGSSASSLFFCLSLLLASLLPLIFFSSSVSSVSDCVAFVSD